jgi:hypothetical protein
MTEHRPGTVPAGALLSLTRAISARDDPNPQDSAAAEPDSGDPPSAPGGYLTRQWAAERETSCVVGPEGIDAHGPIELTNDHQDEAADGPGHREERWKAGSTTATVYQPSAAAVSLLFRLGHDTPARPLH